MSRRNLRVGHFGPAFWFDLYEQILRGWNCINTGLHLSHEGGLQVQWIPRVQSAYGSTGSILYSQTQTFQLVTGNVTKCVTERPSEYCKVKTSDELWIYWISRWSDSCMTSYLTGEKQWIGIFTKHFCWNE